MLPPATHLLALALVQAAGQGDSQTLDLTPVQLPRIEIRAPRLESGSTRPLTQVTVVSGEQLIATGERSLPGMIGSATGVWIQETNLGGGSPFIRGLTGNQILLVIDGMRINDSTTRFGPNQVLNGIDPSIVERVEVIRGPASVLYGSDAIGGVVAIWTRGRAPSMAGGVEGVRAEQRAELQSQTEGWRGSANVSDAGERLGWFVSGAWQDWGDLRAGDGEVQEFTGYSGGELFGSATFDLGRDQSLRWSSRLHRDEDVPRTDKLIDGFATSIGGAPTPAPSVLYQFALQEYVRHQLTWTDSEPGPLADEMQVRLSARRTREVRERIDVSNLDRFRVEADEVLTFAVGVDWRRDLGRGHLLTWGLDASDDAVESGRVDTTISTGVAAAKDGRFPTSASYSQLGLFAQDEFGLGELVDLTLGLRYSRYDFEFDPRLGAPVGLPISSGGEGQFDQLTASLQAAADFLEQFRLGGTVAQGFRAPNLADLSQINTFGGGLEVGSTDLEPEQSLYSELALDYRGDGVEAGVAVFHNEITDAIGRQFDAAATAAYQAADPVNNVEDVYLLVNRDRVVIWGAEARGSARLGGPDSPFRVDGALAYQRGQQYSDVDPAADDVPYRRVPPLNGRLALAWAPEGRRGSALERVRLVTRFADRQDRLAPGDISDPRIDPDGTPGWAVLDLGFEGRLGVWDGTWNLVLQNLLDRNYRVHGSGFDAPGFGATLQLSWAF